MPEPYNRNKNQNLTEISMEFKHKNFEGVVNPTNARSIWQKQKSKLNRNFYGIQKQKF